MDALLSLVATSGLQGVQSATSQQSRTQVASVLAQLAPGTLVSGFVLNRDAKGNTILRSELGDLLVQSKYFLKIGSDVVLKVENTGTNTPKASIVSVDGKPPQESESIPAHATDDDVVQRSDQPRAPISGNTRELLNQAAAARANNAPATQTTQQANSQTVDITREPAAQIRTAPPQSPVLQGTLTPLTGNTAAPAGQPATAAQPPASPSMLSFRVIQVTPPAAAPLPTTPAAPGTESAATVATKPTTTTAPAAGQSAPPAPQQAAQAATAGTLPATTTTPASQSTFARADTPVTPPAGNNPPANAGIETLVGRSTPPATQAASAYARLAVQAAPAAALPPSASPGIATTTGPTPQVSTSPLVPGLPTFTGTVLRLTTSGEPLLATPQGMLRFHSALPLQAGSQVTLQLTQPLDKASASLPTTPVMPAAALAALAEDWNTLDQIVKTLGTLDPAMASQLLQVLSPATAASDPKQTTGQNLSSGMLFFLSALSGGDIKGMLGEKATKLLEQNGHTGLLTKAQGELSLLKSFLPEPTPGQWQPMFFPVVVEGEMKTIRFYVKRDKKRQGKENLSAAQNDTRFVVEFEMSQLGEMQLDGLVKKKPGTTQFDLVIRSHDSLDPQAEQTMRDIFASIGDATGYRGMLLFQQAPDFPVKPLEEIAAQTHGEMTA